MKGGGGNCLEVIEDEWNNKIWIKRDLLCPEQCRECLEAHQVCLCTPSGIVGGSPGRSASCRLDSPDSIGLGDHTQNTCQTLLS